MPAWTLSGSRTWLPVAEPPPGRDSAGPNLPPAAQPVLPWSVAAPIDWSRPLLAAVVPVPSSKAYRMGTPDPGGGPWTVCVRVPVESRHPSAAVNRASTWWSPRVRVTPGNVAVPAARVTVEPTATPSTHSATVPLAGWSSSPSTVAVKATGSANGDGEAGSAVSVVVVRSAVPSSYRAATSSAESVDV